MMGRIADHIATMRGRSLADICAQIERMEAETLLAGMDDFDAFWQQWPHKVGKPDAKKAYIATVKRGNSHRVIMEGVVHYIHDKPADRPWLNPATFLRQERFNDQPAATSPQLKGVAAQRATLRQEIADGYERDGQANSNSGHDRRLALSGPDHDHGNGRRLL